MFGFFLYHFSPPPFPIIWAFYFLLVIPNSCGLSPECNIHCYVLDVSMPKHTMHCTTWPGHCVTLAVHHLWFVYVVVLSTGRGRVPACDVFNVCRYVWGQWVCMAYWKTIHPNQIPQIRNKKKGVYWCLKCNYFTFQCAAMVCYCRIFMWLFSKQWSSCFV